MPSLWKMSVVLDVEPRMLSVWARKIRLEALLRMPRLSKDPTRAADEGDAKRNRVPIWAIAIQRLDPATAAGINHPPDVSIFSMLGGSQFGPRGLSSNEPLWRSGHQLFWMPPQQRG